MNHIYKVIWNKAKHCYTVVSEIAKSHSDSTKRVRVGTTAALMAVAVLTGFAMPAQAAVSIGTDGTVKAEAADINALNNLLKNGVTTNKDGSVTVGGLTVKKNGEVSVNSPDVVYGKNAKIIWDSNNTMGQISIGNNATAITGHGGQERAFAYDGDVNHAAGAIAIGANTYARTGSIMIGSHVYKGNMGDVTGIDTDSFNTDSNGAYGFTVNSTTIGTNSFTRGNLATTIGDYNIQSGKSRGYGWNSLLYGAQNFGATVIGALNSNESQSAGSGMSGIANSIVGVANKVNSSNGTLVFGAGNEVTNSLTGIYGVDDTTSLRDATAAQNALKNAVAESDAGGAVLAIGGANKADWARKSQLIGVGNTLTGASSAVSEYNMINGYKNEVTNATHTSIIGSNNKAKNIQSTIVMGDNNTLEGRKNVISLGNKNTVDADEAVAIGNGTTVTAESGVAIGAGSIADRVAGSEKGALGAFAPANIPTGEESTWTSTKGAVSVGDTANNITRQITNVAAGSEDTDAVNVAQLKQVASQAERAKTTVSDGTNTTVTSTEAEDGHTDYKVNLNENLTGIESMTNGSSSIRMGNGGTVTINNRVTIDQSGKISGVAAGEISSTSTDAVNGSQLHAVQQEAGKHTKVVNGSNITVEETDQDGQKTYKVGLNKDLLLGDITGKNVSISGTNGTIETTGSITTKDKIYAAKGAKLADIDIKGDTISNVQSSGSKGQSKIVLNEANTGMVYGATSVVLNDNGVYLNGKVNVDKAGQIHNVTAGTADEDAVNVSQLKKQTAASKTTVSDGTNTTVTSTEATDGHTDYKVDLNKDLTGIESISNGSKGQSKIVLNEGYAGMSYGDTNVVLRDNGVYLNGKVNVDKAGQIHNVTAGTADEDAVNVSQLKKQTAASKTTVSDGINTTVTSTKAKDGHTDYKVNLNKDLTGIESMTNGSSSIHMGKGGTVTINKKVTIDQSGKISGVAAGEISSTSTDAVNGSQLHAVQQEAGKHTKVVNGSNITVEETDQDGQKTYKVGLNKDLLLGDITGKNVSISGTNGTIETTGSITTKDKIYAAKGAKLADIDITGDTISNGQSSVKLDKEGTVTINGKVNVDKAGQIHNVTAGTADEDAVNVSQLNKQAAASKTTVSDGTNTTVTSTVAKDGHTDYKVNLNKDLTGIESMANGLSSIRMGNGGTVTINNRVTIDQSGKISGVAAGEVKEGSTDAVNGSQLKGVENKADKNAENIQKNTEAIAKNTADISKNAEAISKNTENIKNNSKAIAENAKNIQKNTEAIAKNTADISKNTEAIGKLDERVTKVEEVAKKHTTVSTDDTNVQINEDTNKDGGKDYKVSLNKDLNLSSVTTGDTKMDTNGVTVKDVSLTKDGLSIGNKTYVSDKGLNANDQKVTNVAAGDLSEKSTDAVNGSQLFATNQQVVQNAQSISKLGNRINKVGAGAAALAALHPLDFDPDDKWDIAAGYGNYNGENAAAIGAYYRPNEDTMFSVGGSFGNGENMVNAGVSLKLGQGNHVSTSKVAMAKEIKDLRKEMEGLKSALLDANAGKKLDTSKLQLFPDVPKNHWAYEYVSTLKGNGVLTGYPDGEFKGDRPMTRYEFATMLYKAMLEGATLSDRILKEFAPELERFTVDTVHQDKDGKPTVERVRTVKAAK